MAANSSPILRLPLSFALLRAQMINRGVADPEVLTVLPDRMERYFSTELFAKA